MINLTANMASGNKPAQRQRQSIPEYNLPRHQGWNRIQKPAPDCNCHALTFAGLSTHYGNPDRGNCWRYCDGSWRLVCDFMGAQAQLELHTIQQQSKINGCAPGNSLRARNLRELYEKDGGGLLSGVQKGEPFLINISFSEKYFIVIPTTPTLSGRLTTQSFARQ